MRNIPWSTFAIGALWLISAGVKEGQALQSAPPVQSKPAVTAPRGRIVGIGGVFFKSANRNPMREWYAKHLGIDDKGGGAMLPWREQADPQKEHVTVWTVFSATSTYFDPSPAPFMINYIVDDMDALLDRLKQEGVKIDEKRMNESYGKFAWIYDLDGNKIELWQPTSGKDTILGATFSLSAQQSAPGARIVRAEGKVTLNGQPVAAGTTAVALGDVADLQTATGRVVIALKRGGTFVLGENAAAKVHANGVYNFNRIEILAGSAVLLSATSSPVVICGTEASLSSSGVFRFDVLSAERMDGSQRCRMRVHEGGASTPGVTFTYVLRGGQEMVMNTRAGDMIPVNPFTTGALDELDRWAREQAAVAR